MSGRTIGFAVTGNISEDENNLKIEIISKMILLDLNILLRIFRALSSL